jgi:hypothetical protein
MSMHAAASNEVVRKRACDVMRTSGNAARANPMASTAVLVDVDDRAAEHDVPHGPTDGIYVPRVPPPDDSIDGGPCLRGETFEERSTQGFRRIIDRHEASIGVQP